MNYVVKALVSVFQKMFLFKQMKKRIRKENHPDYDSLFVVIPLAICIYLFIFTLFYISSHLILKMLAFDFVTYLFICFLFTAVYILFSFANEHDRWKTIHEAELRKQSDKDKKEKEDSSENTDTDKKNPVPDVLIKNKGGK